MTVKKFFASSMITVLLSIIFLPLFSPLHVHAQKENKMATTASFGTTIFGQTDFTKSATVDFGPDPFSSEMKKRAASRKSDFIFFSPEWKEKSGNENLTITPKVGPPSVVSQSCDQDPNLNDGRILNATIATGESITQFIIQVTDQAPGSQTSNSPEFQTPSGSGSQPFQSRINQFVVGHSFALRIAMRNAFTNNQTVYGPTLTFTHLGNGGGGGNGPVVVTGDANNITQTSATLSWSITPNGTPTRAAMVVWVGSQSAPPQYSKPSEGTDAGFVPSPAGISVSGLPPGTVIYYEGLAASINASPTQLLNPSFITGRGGVRSFTTLQSAPTGTAPLPTTLAAEQLQNGLSQFNGTVNPNNAITSYWFEYGRLNTFDLATTATTLGPTTGLITVSSTVSLSPGDYNIRLVAQNQFGLTRGTIVFFTVQNSNTGDGELTGTAVLKTANGKLIVRAFSTSQKFTDTLVITVNLGGDNKGSMKPQYEGGSGKFLEYFELKVKNVDTSNQGNSVTLSADGFKTKVLDIIKK